MQQPGPEEQQLRQRAGTWTVKVTFRPTWDSGDHEFVRQYWVQADGTGQRWLAVEYEYTRRR